MFPKTPKNDYLILRIIKNILDQTILEKRHPIFDYFNLLSKDY